MCYGHWQLIPIDQLRSVNWCASLIRKAKIGVCKNNTFALSCMRDNAVEASSRRRQIMQTWECNHRRTQAQAKNTQLISSISCLPNREANAKLKTRLDDLQHYLPSQDTGTPNLQYLKHLTKLFRQTFVWNITKDTPTQASLTFSSDWFT